MTKELSEIYRINIEKRTGLKLQPLPNNAKYEVGKTYYCGFWQQWFTVLEYRELNDWRGWVVKCKWQDGSITFHGTPLNLGLNDYLVVV